MKKLSDRLASLVEGKTQAEFAASIGVHLNSFSAWLRGERYPSCEAIAKICTVYCVSADWLLGLSDARSLGRSDRMVPVCNGCEQRDATIQALSESIRMLTFEMSKKTGTSGSRKSSSASGARQGA